MDNGKEFFTLDETAAILQVSKATIWRHHRSGKLRSSMKIGNRLRFTLNDIEQFSQTESTTIATEDVPKCMVELTIALLAQVKTLTEFIIKDHVFFSERLTANKEEITNKLFQIHAQD